ncbi:hypothetical protein PGTUg99_027926 [Puccinia graminis f. sp. tritici]|uniref:Uncharacterized protein n=1 Tax=Puccinia graminis f. sp. tritici TaxID=56615 RepID=A0A5B0RF79_PUCGR|nr:hypothetical protein PGTUg99_027926 [Puccinia graminis f. sp. tritici]
MGNILVDLIAQAFERSLRKIQGNIAQLARIHEFGSQAVSPEFESHLHEIKTLLLPSLKGGLDRMRKLLLSPIYPQKREALNDQSAAAILAEVDNTVDRITYLTNSLSLEGGNRGYMENWDLNSYRCQMLQYKIVEILKKIEGLLSLYNDQFQLFATNTIFTTECDWEKVIEDTYLAKHAIDNVIKSFELSVLGLLRARWQRMAQGVEVLLQDAIGSGSELHFQPLLDTIPVIKLTRLFFNKLSKPTNGEPHPLSQMSSDQLLALIKTTHYLPLELDTYITGMEYDDAKNGGIHATKVFDLVEKFQPSVKILIDHLSHKGPNAESSQDSKKYREWYRLWSRQLSLFAGHFCTKYPLNMRN